MATGTGYMHGGAPDQTAPRAHTSKHTRHGRLFLLVLIINCFCFLLYKSPLTFSLLVIWVVRRSENVLMNNYSHHLTHHNSTLIYDLIQSCPARNSIHLLLSPNGPHDA